MSFSESFRQSGRGESEWELIFIIIQRTSQPKETEEILGAQRPLQIWSSVGFVVAVVVVTVGQRGWIGIYLNNLNVRNGVFHLRRTSACTYMYTQSGLVEAQRCNGANQLFVDPVLEIYNESSEISYVNLIS